MKHIKTIILTPILYVLLYVSIAFGDTAPILSVHGRSVTPINVKNIILYDEVINIYLYRNLTYTVEVDYTFINVCTKREVLIGFPEEYPEKMEPAEIKDFKAFDGKKELLVFNRNVASGSDYSSFKCFKVYFKKGDLKKIPIHRDGMILSLPMMTDTELNIF